MALDYGPPIYQAYVDAVKSNIQQQEAKMELGLHAVELQQGIINIQNQMAERKAIADAYTQDAQPAQQGGQTGAQGPQGGGQANPATGQPPADTAERTAQVYDKIAAKLGPVNPKLALEYSTKASTLRDQAMTRQKGQLEVTQKQTEMIGSIFGSVQPGDQEGYTEALQKATGMGLNISTLGLTGNVVTDYPKLQKVAQGSMTFKQQLDAKHQKVTEDQADLNYREKVQYDGARIKLEGAKVGMEASKIDLDKQWKSDELSYRARADARAQAGLERTDAMDLSKSKDFAGRSGKADAAYVQSVIGQDPDLALLPDNQKQNVTQQLVMGARSALSKSVTKPGQSVTADDFTREVDKLLPMVKKGIDPGAKGGWLGLGKKETTLKSPLPQAIDSKEQFQALPVGAQFRKGDKMYTKKSATDVEEIK